MNAIEIIIAFLLWGIFFLFALAFAYYALKNARLMKGPLGHRLMAFGGICFVIPVIGGITYTFFPDTGLVYGLLIIWVTALSSVVAGGLLRAKTIKEVHGISLPKLFSMRPTAKYYLIAIATLVFISVPAYSFGVSQPPAQRFSWYFVGTMSAIFTFVILAITERKFHLAVQAAAAAAAAAWPEELLLRDDIRALRAYSSLTNGLLACTAPAIGANGVRDVLARCAENHPIILEGHEPTKDGMLNWGTLIKNLDRIHEAERVQELFSTFSDLNTGLIDFYAAVTSPERAGEEVVTVVARSVERYGGIISGTGMPLGKYSEIVHKREMLFGFPEVSALFERVLEPLLKECDAPTILRIGGLIKELAKDAPLAGRVEIAEGGDIRLDGLYPSIAVLPPEERLKEAVSAFSKIMGACYPIIQADLGAEKAKSIASKAFSDLLEKHRIALIKHGIMEAIPEGVEIPGTYRPLDPGKSYLVEGRTPEQAFKMFADMVGYGFPGLCISTSYPADIKKEYKLAGRATVLWLSKAEKEYAVPPSNLGILRDRISTFVSREENAVVLLDGLEYLITTNGFDMTLKFLHDVREEITLNRARLVVPIAPGTLEAKQLELLERYMEVIEVVEEERK